MASERSVSGTTPTSGDLVIASSSIVILEVRANPVACLLPSVRRPSFSFLYLTFLHPNVREHPLYGAWESPSAATEDLIRGPCFAERLVEVVEDRGKRIEGDGRLAP